MQQRLFLTVLVGSFYCMGNAHACERLPVDPEFPAGLGGAYEIVGKDPRTGRSYSGTLSIGYGKDVYTLTRTVAGKTMHGEAWIERCGIDKITSLIARYDAGSVIELRCALGNDGDNYFRVTCQTRQAHQAKTDPKPGHKVQRAQRDWHGLEAWFQKP